MAENSDFSALKLRDNIWHIEDITDPPNRDSVFLIAGSRKAALIDTGMGRGDLAAFVRTLTRLPLVVLITHGHFDHVGKIKQFTTVYYPQKDAHMNLPTYPDVAEGTLPLEDGAVFDLGGKTIETIEVPGHSPGSVVFLDREDRMLFSGDAVGSSFVWMHAIGSVPLDVYLESLKRLEKREKDFDGIYGGHYCQSKYMPLPPCYITDMRTAVEKVLSGEIAGEPYPYPQPPEPDSAGLIVSYGCAKLVYTLSRLRSGPAR